MAIFWLVVLGLRSNGGFFVTKEPNVTLSKLSNNSATIDISSVEEAELVHRPHATKSI